MRFLSSWVNTTSSFTTRVLVSMGILETNLRLLPQVPDIRSTIGQFEQTAGGIFASIEGVGRQQLMSFEGTVGSMLGSFTEGHVFAAMSSFKSVSQTIANVVPYAGVISGALSLGKSVVDFLGSIFGGSSPPPSPSVDGARVNALQGWDVLTGGNDFFAEVLGRLAAGKEVHEEHGADVGRVKQVAYQEARDSLTVALERAWQTTGDSGRSERRTGVPGRINPQQYRSLSIVLANMNVSDLKDMTSPKNWANLAALIAYGAPRLQLRYALASLGLTLLSEASWASSAYKGTGSDGNMRGFPLNYSCQPRFIPRTVTSRFAGIPLVIASGPLDPREHEAHLCRQAPGLFAKSVGFHVLPMVNVDKITGRLSHYEQISKQVLSAESDYLASHAPRFWVHSSGKSFSWVYGDRKEHHGVVFPRGDYAVAGCVATALKYTSKIESYELSLKALRAQNNEERATRKVRMRRGVQGGIAKQRARIARERAGPPPETSRVSPTPGTPPASVSSAVATQPSVALLAAVAALAWLAK